MIKRIRTRRWQIPDSLAVAAALLLAVSAFVGVGLAPPAPERPAAFQTAGTGQDSGPAASAPDAVQRNSSRKTRGFKASLFLFRH